VSDPEWPAITYETVDWEPATEYAVMSRRDRRRQAGPYPAAIPERISSRDLNLPDEVAGLADEASAELARFDAELGNEIAPFASVLLRSESAASSQIENLSASARAIAEAELGDPSRRNATKIVANTRAMDAAIALAEDLLPASILAMHGALLEVTDPDIAGRWRDQPVWIGGSNVSPHGAAFIPPHHSRVEPAIQDLVNFMARDDIPVLSQVAVAHAQFETIHPFPDGNGRTGRALLQAMLRNKGLTRNVTVPISAGLLVDTDSYFAALNDYRTGDPTQIVQRMSEAAFPAVGNGRELVAELRAIRAGWNEQMAARRDSRVWQLADLLIRHPVVNADLVARELGIFTSNVYRLIEPLEDAGIIIGLDNKVRNRIWRSPEVLAALDAFAARAGRRVAGRA